MRERRGSGQGKEDRERKFQENEVNQGLHPLYTTPNRFGSPRSDPGSEPNRPRPVPLTQTHSFCLLHKPLYTVSTPLPMPLFILTSILFCIPHAFYFTSHPILLFMSSYAYLNLVISLNLEHVIRHRCNLFCLLFYFCYIDLRM